MGLVSAVFWDVGGVLLTNGWDHKQRYGVLEHFGVAREPFETLHAECNDAWEKDRISVTDYLNRTLFYEPRSFTPEEFLAEMKAQSTLLPNTAFEILKQVGSSAHLEVAIVNNESRVLNDYRVEKFGLTEFVDCFVSSCYVGLRKPLPEIYKVALDLLRRKPEEVVFIDDRAENVAAGEALGIRGIVHRTAAETAAALNALGVEVTV